MATPPNKNEAGQLSASSLSISSCGHGSVFIRLHGPDGEIFAYASMPALVAVDVSNDLVDEIQRAVAASGVCESKH